MKKTIIVLTALITIVTTITMTIKANGFKTASMEEVSYDNAQPYLEAFQKVIKIPNGYSFHSVNKIKADDVQAYLFRFEKI